jgi:hypothetical protein
MTWVACAIALTASAQAGEATKSGQAVCDDLDKGLVTPIAYDHMHALPTYYERDLTVEPGLAKVDIDNDGRTDNVVRARYEPEHCESAVLAVVDDTRTLLLENPLNELLRGGLKGDRCRVRLSLFARGGVVYIQSDNDPKSSRNSPVAELADNYTVFVLHGDRASKVCSADPAKGLLPKQGVADK